MEMPGAEYVIKKVLAFILIFFISGVLGEAVVIDPSQEWVMIRFMV
jgi:hypothetical protein